ncbi:MAG: anti-sigma factor antagonist [Pseudanabaenaceae cyanobacterium]
MEIRTETTDSITVVSLQGDIDASTAPQVQETVLPLVTPGSKLLMDMSGVPYLSSAGLRALLSLYRQVSAKDGKLVLVGLSEEIADTMSITGFLDFFAARATVAEGLQFLQEG